MPAEASRPGSAPSSRLATACQIAALSLVPLAIGILGYRRRWLTEDAFLTLRVVQHLLAGHGPVYNLGERVEAFTHPLWLVVLWPLAALGAPLEATAVYLGLALTVLGVAAAQMGAVTLCRRLLGPARGARGRLLVPLGVLVFIAPSAIRDFATSGLETGLGVFWLGGSYWMLASQCLGRAPGPADRPPLVAAFVMGLGPLVRPDLAPFSAAFLLGLAWAGPRPATRARSIRAMASLVASGGLAPIAYQVFRMGYFAALVPNTAIAKEAGRPYWHQGLAYLQDFAGAYRLWIPGMLLLPWLVGLGWLAWRRRDRAALAVLAAPVLAAAVHALYVARVGGDFMHGRFLVPTLLAILLPVAVAPLGPLRSRAGLARAALGVVVLGWAAACVLWMRPPYGEQFSRARIADERAYYTGRLRHPNPLTLADYLGLDSGWAMDGLELRERALSEPRQVITGGTVAPLSAGVDAGIRLVAAAWNVGALGFAAGLDIHVVDRLGLADPIAARLALLRRGRPGHEKALPEPWVLARFGDGVAGSPEVAAAREALACGDLAALRAAVEEPLTVARFTANVALAWRLTRLRIPADPEQARAALCRPP